MVIVQNLKVQNISSFEFHGVKIVEKSSRFFFFFFQFLTIFFWHLQISSYPVMYHLKITLDFFPLVSCSFWLILWREKEVHLMTDLVQLFIWNFSICTKNQVESIVSQWLSFNRKAIRHPVAQWTKLAIIWSFPPFLTFLKNSI